MPPQQGSYGVQSPPLIPPAGSMPGALPYGARPGSRGGAPHVGGPRYDSPSGPRQSSQPQPQMRPVHTPSEPGRASAPPVQQPAQARPTPPPSSHGPSGVASPAPSTASSAPKPQRVETNHPDGKTFGKGPATFDEMGVARVKDKDDCVSDRHFDELTWTKVANDHRLTGCHVNKIWSNFDGTEKMFIILRASTATCDAKIPTWAVWSALAGLVFKLVFTSFCHVGLHQDTQVHISCF